MLQKYASLWQCISLHITCVNFIRMAYVSDTFAAIDWLGCVRFAGIQAGLNLNAFDSCFLFSALLCFLLFFLQKSKKKL